MTWVPMTIITQEMLDVKLSHFLFITGNYENMKKYQTPGHLPYFAPHGHLVDFADSCNTSWIQP